MRRHHTPDPRRKAKLPTEPEPPERTGPALSWDMEQGIEYMYIDDHMMASVTRTHATTEYGWIVEEFDAKIMTTEIQDSQTFDNRDAARLWCEQRFSEVMK